MKLNSLMTYLILIFIFTAGCTTYVAQNDLIPEGETIDSSEVAVLVVAYPLKPNSINGEAVENVGSINTIFRMKPGDVQLDYHMDTADHWSDSLLVATYTDTSSPFSTTTYYQPAEATESSAVISETFRTYPGDIHFFRIVMKDNSRFWTGFTHGPNPMKTPNGIEIRFDAPGNTVFVDNRNGIVEYDLNEKMVFFSWDRKHVAFMTSGKKGWTTVIDGVPNGPWDSIHTVSRAWSPDGSQFAFGAYVKKSMMDSDLYLVINDEKIGPYQAIDPGTPMFFDADGNIVCAIKKDDTWHFKRGSDETPMASEAAASEAIWALLDSLTQNR
ncbi:MAG: hypothetical protein RQ801_13930 [Spirochaetaceae bacterium]|nr:hypothetical protein [Spirochaetaceae bacterium]MDT8299400.1 hypothetical protein [Spirochaetaceae bacterium]